MRKIMMLAFAVLVFTSVAMAQGYVTGATGIMGSVDNLGAHQNGGRGCVGCHTPHSGARGNGGVLTGTSQYQPTTLSNGNPGNAWTAQPAVTDSTTGDTALWGQDIGPVLSNLASFSVGGTSVSLSLATSTQPKMLSGVVFCLSCHDGNVSKGAMMTNQSFEQAAGLLPSTYGSLPIPTLLGNDGTGGGNYANDHPIGPNANIGAVYGGPLSNANPYIALSGTKIVLSSTPGPYATFQTNYGLPVIFSGLVVDNTVTTVQGAYVVCTTCHNQHSMYVYTSKASASSGNTGIANDTGGKNYPTYFFINAPYNPGASVATGKASSATQFCRQCHFSNSNEASGITGITTQF